MFRAGASFCGTEQDKSALGRCALPASRLGEGLRLLHAGLDPLLDLAETVAKAVEVIVHLLPPHPQIALAALIDLGFQLLR